MRRSPHFREAGFQNARAGMIVLRQNTARVVKMETAHVMRFVSHGERLGNLYQMFGRLVDVHAVAELAQ